MDAYCIEGGFQVELGKSIPAGAGMGGASSDAAAALRCAAALCQIDPYDPGIYQIATEIGSDVPFFLGLADAPVQAARATGRGEQIMRVAVAEPLDFVVVFPPFSLSTALVYANCLIPPHPQSADPLIAALGSGNRQSLQTARLNRLAPAAKKIRPQLQEFIESMWRNGLRNIQLTGSGSACFDIAASEHEAVQTARQVQGHKICQPNSEHEHMELGVRARAARSIFVPSKVQLIPIR
jgi:4-diphosphocytidyl-2-C-methyl-D-erythritol kinase